MIYLYFYPSLWKNEHSKISSELKISARHEKQTMNFFFLFFFIFLNREPSKSFFSVEVLCSNTARMASGGQWILLDNDWEQRSSGLL